MNNLVFIGISPTEKVGKNATPKAEVALLQKEQYNDKVNYILLVCTAWKSIIDQFSKMEQGMVIPNVEIKPESRLYKGKVFHNLTITSVEGPAFHPQKGLSPETLAKVKELAADFATLGTDAPAPAKKSSPAPLTDDLPF